MGLLNQLKETSILKQAEEIQMKASLVGFDWDSPEPIIEKIYEEIDELKVWLSPEHHNPAELEKEFGDCLFALLNLGRKLNIDPERALWLTIEKFQQRFNFIEQELNKVGKTPESASLDEMEALWQLAKTHKYS